MLSDTQLRRTRVRAVLALLTLAAVAAGCERGARVGAPEGKRLNVVLITIDTLRADALGAYGQKLPTSPTLDALAAEGVLFEQADTVVPSTLPSHSSIMTGRMPYVHGVRDNEGYVLTDDNVTLAEVLRDYGYRTAAEIAAPVIGRRTQLNQGFEQYRDLHSYDIEQVEVDVNGTKQRLIERGAADITNRGLDVLAAMGDDPFFVWLHYFDPHVFYAAPAVFNELIPQSPYHAEVRYVDTQIARVIAALRTLGVADRTLVVVVGDHGEGLGEHDEGTHSYMVYETTMHVPLIFWGPGVIREPRRVASLVRTIDIAPTLLELLGLPPLADAQGVSLVPLLEGKVDSLGLVAYGESARPMLTFGTSMLRYVREGNWKYIHKVSPELYDLASDPSELDNLATQREDVRKRLRAELGELVESAPAPKTDAFADVDPTTQAHLQALGYVATGTRADVDELTSLEVSGVDPTSLGPDIRKMAAGHAFWKAGRAAEAEPIFRELRERHPKSVAVLLGLVGTLQRMGVTEGMEELYREGIELSKTEVEFHVGLAQLEIWRRNYDRAEELLREALARQPCSVLVWVKLSNALHAAGEYARQHQALEEALGTCPGATDVRNDLAYALSTSPDGALRDGPRALDLARKVVAEAGTNPAYLDTLACALAETGDYTAAAQAGRRATKLLRDHGAPPFVLAHFEQHLTSFEAGEPVRDAASDAAGPGPAAN